MIQTANWYIYNFFMEVKSIFESLTGVIDDTLYEVTLKLEFFDVR